MSTTNDLNASPAIKFLSKYINQVRLTSAGMCISASGITVGILGLVENLAIGNKPKAIHSAVGIALGALGVSCLFVGQNIVLAELRDMCGARSSSRAEEPER